MGSCTCFAELLAKKQKRDQLWAATKAASAVEAKKKAKATRSAIFKKAEGYAKAFRTQVLQLTAAHVRLATEDI